VVFRAADVFSTRFVRTGSSSCGRSGTQRAQLGRAVASRITVRPYAVCLMTGGQERCDSRHIGRRIDVAAWRDERVGHTHIHSILECA